MPISLSCCWVIYISSIYYHNNTCFGNGHNGLEDKIVMVIDRTNVNDPNGYWAYKLNSFIPQGLRPRTHGNVFLHLCIVSSNELVVLDSLENSKQYKNARKRFRVFGALTSEILCKIDAFLIRLYTIY